MKWKISFPVIILITVAFIPALARSQSSVSMDELSFADFDMCPAKIGYSSPNTVFLSRSAFIRKFGPPMSKSRDSSEMDEKMMDHYIYKGAEVWYHDKMLQTLRFTSPAYHFVTRNKRSAKVGDSILTIAGMFPSSWAARNSNQVFIALRNSKGPVDVTLLFEFDPDTKRITGISIQE